MAPQRRFRGFGRALAPLVLALSLSATAMAAEDAIALPKDGDTYSQLVAKAEAGDPKVDFGALRQAWLDSKARKRVHAADVYKLRTELGDALKTKDPAQVAAAARRLLSVEYVNIDGHEVLRASCETRRDAACEKRHRAIETGLLQSIMDSGDGKSCKTGWQVISVDEEYVFLRITGFKKIRQELIKDPSFCDLLDTVDDEGKAHGLYFKIDSFLTRELD
jgi:hypothetical protein